MRNLLFGIIILGISFPSVAPGQEKVINILFTGGLSGELESCGCSPKTDYGGLSRMSRYILENKKEFFPYILIDAGNFADRDTPQGRLKVEAMLKSFKVMQYDAVALLKNEKAFPSEFFTEMIVREKVPYVSDTYPCKRSLTMSFNNIDIHLSSDPADYRKDHLGILLTDQSIDISRFMTHWDIIINSSGEILEEPLRIDNTVIVAGYPKGEKLGILRLIVTKSGKIKDFKHRWQPLGSDIKDDILVRNILKEYDAKVAQMLKESERPLSGTSYVGVSNCAECHQPFVESWKKTRHAKAFASLDEAGKSADPECVICHTVGFGEEGGFHTIDTTPELANVQCEECHGLNREHVQDFSKPLKKVTESVCLKCHTQDNSPDFDYPLYLKKIIH